MPVFHLLTCRGNCALIEFMSKSQQIEERIAERLVKILASVLFSIWLCAIGSWLYCISQFPFCKHHPGIVLVVVGFFGAVVFGHESSKALGKRLAWWCDMLLLIGLLLEMNEAVNEDSKILALQKQLQPRTISNKQIYDFIFLTERISKAVPIKIHATFEGDDTFQFAVHIRAMLDKAGFQRDSSANGIEEDAAQNRTTHIFRDVGWTNEWPSLFLIRYGTNVVVTNTDIPKELTNGFVRPIVSEPNTQRIYEAIGDCLTQIGANTMWLATSNLLSPGEYEIYVPPKNH